MQDDQPPPSTLGRSPEDSKSLGSLLTFGIEDGLRSHTSVCLNVDSPDLGFRHPAGSGTRYDTRYYRYLITGQAIIPPPRTSTLFGQPA